MLLRFIFLRRHGSRFGSTSRHQILYNLASIDKVLKGHHALETHPIALTIVLRGFGAPVSRILRENFADFSRAMATAIERGFVNDATATAAIQRGHIPKKISDLLSFSEDPQAQRPWEKAASVKLILSHHPNKSQAVELDLRVLLQDLGACISIPLLYGQDFLDRNPRLLEDFWRFDNDAFPMLVLGAPTWLPITSFKDGIAARERLQKALTGFYERMEQYQKGEAIDFDADMTDVSTVALERHRIFEEYNVSVPDCGKLELGVLWAQNANTHPVSFWFALYIYSTPGLLGSLREEIKSYLTLSETSELVRITALDLSGLGKNCPLLKSALYETFRLVNEPTSIRYVSQPVTVFDGEYQHHLRPGTWITAPHYGVQHDPSVFHHPQKFLADRFIETGKQTGRNMTGYMGLRPWGAGSGICKGRTFAEKQILAVTACLISLWDMEPSGKDGWKLPGSLPGTGVLRPRESVRVIIKRRIFQ